MDIHTFFPPPPNEKDQLNLLEIQVNSLSNLLFSKTQTLSMENLKRKILNLLVKNEFEKQEFIRKNNRKEELIKELKDENIGLKDELRVKNDQINQLKMDLSSILKSIESTKDLFALKCDLLEQRLCFASDRIVLLLCKNQFNQPYFNCGRTIEKEILMKRNY